MIITDLEALDLESRGTSLAPVEYFKKGESYSDLNK